MAVDRISEFILFGMDDRMPAYPILVNNVYTNIDQSHTSTIDVMGIIERDFSKDDIEIPVIYITDTINKLYDSLDYNADSRHKYINFISCRSRDTERKQVTTIMRDFTYNGSTQMYKVSNKGNIYYGCPGLILDSDFNTLLCIKVRLKIIEGVINVVDYICYISPKIFINQDRIIEKTIYKKVIPFCSSYVLHNDFPHKRFGLTPKVNYDWENKHIKVVIKDDVDVIYKPVKPNIDDFKDNSVINNILTNNIDSLVL